MQTQVTYRHTDDVRPTVRSYAETELAKLTRFYDRISDAHVILSSEGDTKLVEVILHADGQRFTVRETGQHHGAALNRCVNTLRRTLLRHKDQRHAVDPAREVWH
ncbi:MAG: HPF/RaiA family ribosome-associated protein [Bacteroidetes bacterium]|nr:HPF/RaiA family ribosome-associated protein [Bacteroidota bacterium]